MEKDARLLELAKQVKEKDGNEDLVAEAKKILRNDRLAAWAFGTPSLLIRDSLLSGLSYGSPVLRDAIKENLAHLENELGSNEAKGVERLLIDNVLTSWIWVQYVEGRAMTLIEKQHSMTEGRYWQESLDRAHGRFNRAVLSLANYRKVAINIQVNIGEKQVNVANSG